MAEKVRSMMRSASERSTSVFHTGATPYIYIVDFSVLHVEQERIADKICLVLDRRGTVMHTQSAKVIRGKANIQETLRLEIALFRRDVSGSRKGKELRPGEEAKFFPKKVKLILRKDVPSGKALGKIKFNIADHIKGIFDTISANLKLSNSAIVHVSIKSKFLRIGKINKYYGTEGAFEWPYREYLIDSETESDSTASVDVDSILSSELEDDSETADVGRVSHGDRQPPKDGRTAKSLSLVSSDTEIPRAGGSVLADSSPFNSISIVRSFNEGNGTRHGALRKGKDLGNLSKMLKALDLKDGARNETNSELNLTSAERDSNQFVPEQEEDLRVTTESLILEKKHLENMLELKLRSKRSYMDELEEMKQDLSEFRSKTSEIKAMNQELKAASKGKSHKRFAAAKGNLELLLLRQDILGRKIKSQIENLEVQLRANPETKDLMKTFLV